MWPHVRTVLTLDYRWGNIADPKLICSNGLVFKVQQGLFQALFEILPNDPLLV